MTIKHTIHLLGNHDPADKWRGFVIMPNDGTNGYLIGGHAEMAALSQRLDKFLRTGKHDGAISSLDERLGWQWLDISEAVEFARTLNIPVAASTIRKACADRLIADARLDGKTWRFPRATFLGWLKRGSHTRGRPKQT